MKTEFVAARSEHINPFGKKVAVELVPVAVVVVTVMAVVGAVLAAGQLAAFTTLLRCPTAEVHAGMLVGKLESQPSFCIDRGKLQCRIHPSSGLPAVNVLVHSKNPTSGPGVSLSNIPFKVATASVQFEVTM